VFVYSVVSEYEIKGYSVEDDEFNDFYSRLSSLGWRPDFVVSNNEEIVIIEVVYTSDRCKPELIDSIQPFFNRKIRLDKRIYLSRKKRIMVTLDDDQYAILQSLKGMGTKDAERLRNVFVAYISEKSYVKKASQ